MKIIILKTGEVKEVALGYAVNYLLPKKLAVIATKQKLEEIKKKAEAEKTVKNQEETADQKTMKKLEGKLIEMKVLAGKNGKIHGSITKKEIAKELKILKTNIILEEPIKKVGEYEVELKFGKAKGKIKLKISAQ